MCEISVHQTTFRPLFMNGLSGLALGLRTLSDTSHFWYGRCVAFDPVRGDSHIGGYVASDYFALDSWYLRRCMWYLGWCHWYWGGVFGIWEVVIGIWYSVFGIWDGSFGVWDSLFGSWYWGWCIWYLERIWDGVCIWYLGW